MTVSKSELAAQLGWSRDRLDRYLVQHPDFPVDRSASKGVAWRFDLSAALAYIAAEEAVSRSDAAPTPKQRRDAALAEMVERRNRREGGDLVERSEVLAVWTAAVTRLAKSFETLPNNLAREFNWSPEVVRAVRQALDDYRRNFVRDSQPFVDVVDANSADEGG